MASTMAGLLPDTQGVHFTARPALRTRESMRLPSRSGRLSAMGGEMTARSHGSGNAGMSSIEVEAQLRDKVRTKYDSLKQAFQTYDVNKNLSVTKGEFRRVLEGFCFPLTSDQYETVLSKVDRNPNGTVRYCDFLDKFNGRGSAGQERWMSGKHRYSPQPTTREVNIDMVERQVREKISSNLKAVIKAMQLFDYNMDGKIQRHELRRVLENYCLKFTDQQFDKLWQRHDFHHTGTINYRDFLQRMGILSQRASNSPPKDARGAMTWPVVTNHDKQQAAMMGVPTVNHRQQKDQQMMKNMSFTQIEMEFRNRMKSNYVNLKKAFMSFDKHLDGFISLDDLKAILTNFTLPMSDQLFSQLMERCGVRGSNRISWENFLEKFQNPWTAANGQTLPIKPNHKFFPVMETQRQVEAEEIWLQLYDHVQSNYASFKHAFLEFDSNRDGKITRKELRRILEKFAFRLEDEQFKKLMTSLDPNHTNSISYHKFLDVFEEKETREGHKWLKSCHRFNENQKPAIMAWETIEDILREKITEHWKSVAEELMYHDHKAEGVISPAKLKRVIDRCVLPLSQEHFNHLVKKCSTLQADGRISYIEFLERLGVDVIPGDLQGLSSQITDSSQVTEVQRLEQQRSRQDLIDLHVFTRTQTMTADEVIARLKDRLTQHHTAIRRAFLNFDRKARGKISKRVFREVLQSFGILMTDEQFNILVSRLDFHNGFMDYADFLASFSDPRPGGPAAEVPRSDNHHVNPIRGDEYGMSALEVESKLRAKLRENFADLRGAFYKFDDDHNGILNKSNFRRMLDAFMFVMTDEEYEKLCNRMGISKRSRISYQEFLHRFELRDTEEGHKWLNSVHMWNSTIPPEPMTAEAAHQLLRTKVYRQWADIAKAFLTIDKKTGKGLIRRQHLRELLLKFVMPVRPEEFKKLWARYDREGKGYISHQDFLDRLGASDLAPKDEGMSMTIIAESRKTLEDHNRCQQMKHEEITQRQATLGTGMTAEWVERQLRDKIRDAYSDFYSAFKKYDTRKRGWLTVAEIQKVLVDLNFFIGDEEFCRLLDRIGLATDKSRLNYEQFLKAFQDGHSTTFAERDEVVKVDEYQHLNPVDAEAKLQERLKSQGDAVSRAIAAFDKGQKGVIPVSDFRRIVDLFCFKMSEVQWKHLKKRLKVVDNMVHYQLFLHQHLDTEQEDQERWMDILQKTMATGDKSHLMSVDEVEERLHEAVTAHYYNLARDFAEVDYAKIGVVTKDDFRDVLSRHVFRLTDDQFERLWSSLTVNEFGNLDYREFLQQFSSEGDPAPLESVPQALPEPPAPGSRPHTSASSRSSSRQELQRPSTMQSRSISRMSTPLVNADLAERRLKEVVYKHWRDIQRECRIYDPLNTGCINIHDFRELMSRGFNIEMPPEDFRRIVTKYDLKENGTFSYAEFLRHFMLTLKHRESTGFLTRRRGQPPKLMAVPLRNSDVTTRLQHCVHEHWKEMRRAFRKCDEKSAGNVDATDFKRILRHFSVNLSEDEFFNLLSNFDKNMEGLVSYNDFLRAYLQ